MARNTSDKGTTDETTTDSNTLEGGSPEATEGTAPEDTGLETNEDGTIAANRDDEGNVIPGSGHQGEVLAPLQEAADEAAEKGYLGANAADLTGRDKDLTQANPDVMNGRA